MECQLGRKSSLLQIHLLVMGMGYRSGRKSSLLQIYWLRTLATPMLAALGEPAGCFAVPVIPLGTLVSPRQVRVTSGREFSFSNHKPRVPYHESGSSVASMIRPFGGPMPQFSLAGRQPPFLPLASTKSALEVPIQNSPDKRGADRTASGGHPCLFHTRKQETYSKGAPNRGCLGEIDGKGKEV